MNGWTELKNPAGKNIYFKAWDAENPKAVIALVHGLGEHAERYSHVGEWFADHGIAMCGIDLHGFGRSEGLRGHAKNLNAYLQEIRMLIEESKKRYPNSPLVLYGHSMGGLLVLNYLLNCNDPHIHCTVASAPWIRLAFPAPKSKVLAGKMLQRVIPRLRLPNGLAVHFISHDPEVVERYKTDPMVHDKLSTRAGISLLRGSEFLDAYSGDVEVPLLIMHGGDDQITSKEASLEFSQRISGDIQYKEWPGLYHEIHNEPEKEEVFEYMKSWIESKL